MNTLENDHDEIEAPEEEAIDIDVIKFRLVGRTPLLMKSNAGVNPLNKLVKEKASLTAIRSNKRTEEDIMEIYRLDFVLALYHDEEVGPYIPGVNIEAAMLQAAQAERLGSTCKSGIRVVEDMMPLQYRGPRDVETLWKKEFVDIRVGKLRKSASLMICRPCFPKWSIEGTVAYDGSIIPRGRSTVENWIKQVGNIGICDYRKRFGKSNVEILP